MQMIYIYKEKCLISLIKKKKKKTFSQKRPFHTCHLFLKFDKFKVFNNIYIFQFYSRLVV